ncbi:hypothetical protein PoB_000486300 [Plakobranchus ocellatus]|uniref:Peptidase S1 domain-containing protein n=1 Tax=Plakobranchus ocellatus TaxID=259542 RepID=A0AAV3Y7F7_9GAST|nr:hypothetical protein PoB_000486300 [Plakobranchus ocellatus]
MLTVRIRVSKVSKDRPDGYTFFEHRGESMTHVGSGLLTKIASGEGKCCCDECCRDSTRKQKWWIVTIKTACHVVFNTEEAVSTFVDLFYEDEDSLKKGTMKKMHGWRVQDKDEDGDWCMLQCAIHDTDLARQLIECVSLKAHWKRMFVSLQKKLDVKMLCVVVSHPHGSPKYISIGNLTKFVKIEGKIDYSCIYTAATCNGSSGAPVIVPWKLKARSWPGWWSWTAVHSYRLDNGCNQSANGLFHTYKCKPLEGVLSEVGKRVFHFPLCQNRFVFSMEHSL